MAKPYSLDFRQKVMRAIELDGLKKCEASELFNISRNTINLWCQRKAATGEVSPKPRAASQERCKIKDWQKFRDFVQMHGDKSQKEMAALWDAKISQRTMSRALQKIGHTRKKRRTATANEMKPSEECS